MKKLFKKSLAVLLSLSMIVCYIQFVASAAEIYSGTCGDTLTWSLNTSTGVLEISGEGEMEDYSGSFSFNPWSSYQEYIKNVVINDGVASIDDYVFYDCTNLTSIVVDENNNYYANDEYGVLFNKDKTELVKYPIGNTRTSYTIPDGTKVIGDLAFFNCGTLTSITIPDGVTKIGEYALYDCDNLANISIPDSVTSIGWGALYATKYYNNSDNWVDNVLYIGNHLICAKNTLSGSYTVKDNTLIIADGAFNGCNRLTSIVANESNMNYSNDEYGALFNKNKTVLIQYPAGNTRSSYTIPDSVTTIGNSAFYDCNNLTSVTIPDSVTTIDNYAFIYCGGLTSVTLPDSVTTVGNYAFAYCQVLTNVTLRDGVTSVGNYAFYYCTCLTSITIPDSVTTIGNGAFFYCTSLASITIPDSVTTVGNSAFGACARLTNITIPDSVTKIGICAFYGCASLTSITIPDSVTTIGWYAFGECFNLATVTIGNGVTIIGDYVFDCCNSLTNITIPDSVTKIGICAFYGCDSLTSITIPDSVTTIGSGAFLECINLKYVHIPDTVIEIGEYILYDTTAYICSATEASYAKTYADANEIEFNVCTEHDTEDSTTEDSTTEDSTTDDIPTDRTAHNGTLNNYVKTVNDLKTEVSEVIIDNTSYPVKKGTIEYYELDSYLNKEVAFVVKNGEVVFITEIPDISERISFAISTEDVVGYSFYGDNKFSTDSVKLKISIYNTLQTHIILPLGKDGDEHKKNLAALKTLDCLNINPIEVQLSSDSTVFNFNGNSSVHIPVNKCLYAGESFETEVVASLNKGTDLGSYETGAGFTGALSCDLNGSNYVKFDDYYVIITNYNLAPYSPGFSGGTGNQSGTTGGSTTNKDQLAKKAANELKKVQKNSSNGAISLAGSPDLIELIGSDRLDAIGAKMLSVMALSTAPEKTFKDINVLSDAVIEKLFGAKKWFQIWNNKVSFDVVVDTDEYGEIKICFTSESPVYNFNGSNLGSLGQINYEITGGKGKKLLEKSGFPMSGFAGAFTTYDLDSFCDAVFSFVLDELKNSYDIAYGNNLDKAADFIFGDSVSRILSYTDFGSVSGVYWELITFPGKSFKIECPVNIYVYDSDDNLVASIENNQVTLSNEDIYIKINGDTKYIKLPNDSYKIVYVATSKGNLRVTVDEMANYSTSLRTVVIDEIPLVAGAIYTQDLSGAIVADADYSLIDYNGIIYDADYDELNYHTHSSNGVYLDYSEATCEEYGLKCSLCTVCKEWYYIQKEKTSHRDTDHDNYCDVCSESIYLAFEDEIKIKMPSVTKINFGDTLVLQLEEIEIPEGYAIEWFVEGAGVSTSVSEDGLECRVTSIANGNAVISAKIVSENGEAISNADGEAISDEITLVSKAGFWQKFVSFFKNLFRMNRVIY